MYTFHCIKTFVENEHKSKERHVRGLYRYYDHVQEEMGNMCTTITIQ